MPPLSKLMNIINTKNVITEAIIAEVRAPERKLLTKVPLLNAMLKPIIGHKASEHMKQNKPIMSGEDG